MKNCIEIDIDEFVEILEKVEYFKLPPEYKKRCFELIIFSLTNISDYLEGKNEINQNPKNNYNDFLQYISNYKVKLQFNNPTAASL